MRGWLHQKLKRRTVVNIQDRREEQERAKAEYESRFVVRNPFCPCDACRGPMAPGVSQPFEWEDPPKLTIEDRIFLEEIEAAFR
jgi:hypothetical protein